VTLVKKQSYADSTAGGRADFFLIADNLQLVSVAHATLFHAVPVL
jgi:hypothetical protein